MYVKKILIVIILFSMYACSTVKPPEIATIPDSAPQVSKTLETKQERFLKRKVAIARFTNETKYGQGFFYDKNDDRIGKQAMDILSAKLTATEKFIMLERVDLSFLTKEKEMGKINEMNIPADYLIVGSVSEFGRKTESDVGVFSRSKKQTATAKVNVRLIDVKTSQIIYSEEGDGEAFTEASTTLGVGKTAEYDATLNDKVISAAISKLANNIVEHLLDKPWRSYILSFQDNNYIIAGGQLQGLREGDLFNVYQKGKKVVNPQTSVEIELPGKQIGQIKVISIIPGDVNTEVSLCTKIAGDIPVNNFSEYYVQEK